MGFQCGLVGMPNAGKSTLFNALTRSDAAKAENFPFCTIEPNLGSVAVPDARLDILAQIGPSARTVYTSMSFVDIAGLIKGSSQGEGLGNQFLGHVRGMDAIAYVIRCFEDEDVVHVHGHVDPIADIETLETELMLADLGSLEGRVENLARRATSDKTLKRQVDVMRTALQLLQDGTPLRDGVRDGTLERRDADALNLLTSKPVVYVANCAESDLAEANSSHVAALRAYAEEHKAPFVTVCANLEAELSQISDEEAQAWLAELGCNASGLEQFIRAGYELLNLCTFFTHGPKEARAWTVPKGTVARDAAGVIHTDFAKNFIRAETCAYEDYVAEGGAAGARDNGKTRVEGKEYVVQDGDVIYFRVGR